jgi:hypothetical protein
LAGWLRVGGVAPDEARTVPYPDEDEVLASRRLIAHEADVAVLLLAMKAVPDWLLTHNTKHFTPQVAKRTGLRIATPLEFFRALALGMMPG